jgi:hypothetical protein
VRADLDFSAASEIEIISHLELAQQHPAALAAQTFAGTRRI